MTPPETYPAQRDAGPWRPMRIRSYDRSLDEYRASLRQWYADRAEQAYTWAIERGRWYFTDVPSGWRDWFHPALELLQLDGRLTTEVRSAFDGEWNTSEHRVVDAPAPLTIFDALEESEQRARRSEAAKRGARTRAANGKGQKAH